MDQKDNKETLNLFVTINSDSSEDLKEISKQILDKCGKDIKCQLSEVDISDQVTTKGTKGMEGEMLMQVMHIASASHVTLLLVKELIKITRESHKILKNKNLKIKALDLEGKPLDDTNSELIEIKKKIEDIEREIKG
ncbi:MAG: hypothetical protein K8S16_20095 [Bacteroidales bacterium]|nr:hypothetical protein [Bacteroidales bacterium]